VNKITISRNNLCIKTSIVLKIIILINFHFFTRHMSILYLFESTESIPNLIYYLVNLVQ